MIAVNLFKLSPPKHENRLGVGGDPSSGLTSVFCHQVETFGSMEKKEKVDFILEQMRLCLAKKDYIRCSIISKKISTRFFEDSSSMVRRTSH